MTPHSAHPWLSFDEVVCNATITLSPHDSHPRS